MKQFFRKIFSPMVYWNIIAMGVVFIGILIALAVWMDRYTHHGEGVDVPNLKGMMFNDASYELERLGLNAVISDSSYNRSLPAGAILEQIPAGGARVKDGRNIYLVVNAKETPTLPIPDIADNCSLREAEAQLKALGFKLGPIEYAFGDKDWVLDVKCRGRKVFPGERIPIDVPVVLVVGNNDSGDGFEEEIFGLDSIEIDLDDEDELL